jgi:ribonuclease R
MRPVQSHRAHRLPRAPEAGVAGGEAIAAHTASSVKVDKIAVFAVDDSAAPVWFTTDTRNTFCGNRSVSAKVLVELPDFLISGLIHVSSLTDDFFSFDPTRRQLRGRRTGKTYKAGARLRVVVLRIDFPKRQVDFRPA